MSAPPTPQQREKLQNTVRRAWFGTNEDYTFSVTEDITVHFDIQEKTGIFRFQVVITKNDSNNLPEGNILDDTEYSVVSNVIRKTLGEVFNEELTFRFTRFPPLENKVVYKARLAPEDISVEKVPLSKIYR